MRETRMKINNYDIVISYCDRKNLYQLWIDDRLCIEFEENQINVFTTFINHSIEFISKIKSITNEDTKI